MIELDGVSVRAGSFGLDDVSFSIGEGEYGILMGRTGSGKTTLLESICGLKRVVGGAIRLRGQDVTHLPPAARGIGFVPQDGALFGTMSVHDNLAFALRIRNWRRRDIRRRVGELADLLGIGRLLDRRIHALSGGEKQRIALGRALAFHPSILCLDEPMSALDDRTRHELYLLLESVRQHERVTTLHITHNLGEAVRLADVVLFLEAGKVEPSTVDELRERTRAEGRDLEADG